MITISGVFGLGLSYLYYVQLARQHDTGCCGKSVALWHWLCVAMKGNASSYIYIYYHNFYVLCIAFVRQQ